MTRALIADDEPLLRERLRAHLARLWPELEVVGEARNGREAVELFDEHQPEVVFLDVHMPGLSGVDAARSIARRAQIVFVTAFEQYAVQAFEQGGRIEVGGRIDAATRGVSLWVADTGLGLRGAPGNGTGLNNARERLRGLYGADAQIELRPVEPHGVRAELRFIAPQP